MSYMTHSYVYVIGQARCNVLRHYSIFRKHTFICDCVAVCCSVLQCVAVCCSVLQCVTVCCSVLHCVAVCCSVLRHLSNLRPETTQYWQVHQRLHDTECGAVRCSVLQCVAVCCGII